MPRTATKLVYQFHELSDAAKEKAREWYRSCDDGFWQESVYEDADTCAKLIGIDMARKDVRLCGGGTRQDPCIWYSGFSSQGDGACFEGRYAYVKGAAKAIRAHAPQDAVLHAIAGDLQALQRVARYEIEARMKHHGHYYHSGCMSVEVWRRDREDNGDIELPCHEVTQLMRRFADWIYEQLRSEYEWQNSDECVDDMITCNSYEFEQNGDRAR